MEIPFWALCWNVFTRLLSFASHLYLSVLNLYWTFSFFFFSSSHAHNAWLPYPCTANLLTSCSVQLQLSASLKWTHPLCIWLWHHRHPVAALEEVIFTATEVGGGWHGSRCSLCGTLVSFAFYPRTNLQKPQFEDVGG